MKLKINFSLVRQIFNNKAFSVFSDFDRGIDRDNDMADAGIGPIGIACLSIAGANLGMDVIF